MTDIQIRSRFIKDEDLRLLCECHRDPHALSFTAGKARCQAIFQMKRIRLSHDLFYDFSVMRGDARPPVLVRIASAGNELLRCHIFRDLMKLRQEGNDA